MRCESRPLTSSFMVAYALFSHIDKLSKLASLAVDYVEHWIEPFP